MNDDLSAAVSEASDTINAEHNSRGKKKPRSRRLPPFTKPLLLLGILAAIGANYGQQAIKQSGIVSDSEIQIGVNQVLGHVAESVNEFYRREGVLPPAPPHSYLAYAITYQVTGPKEYTLTYEMNGNAITHTYQV